MPPRANLSALVLDEPMAALKRAGIDPQHQPALREMKRIWSLGRLHEEVCQAAGAFRQLGLQPGDRVVLLMHDGVDLAMALLGAVRAGLCAVPLPDTVRHKELLDVLCDAGARAVLAHADLAELALAAASGAPALETALSLGGSLPGLRDFAALCFDADPLVWPLPPGQEPALLLYHTSPNGRPRAHAYIHEAPSAAQARCASVLELTAQDRVLSTARLSSSLGLLLGLFYPLRVGAVSFLLPEVGRGRALFDVLGSFRPTVFAATPTTYRHLVQEYLEMSAPRPPYFRPVRRALSFGEPLPGAVERRTRAVFQIEVLPLFTATEAFGPVLMSGPGNDQVRSGSCGRPLPGLELRVVNDQGQPAAPAEIGQLELRGPLPSGLWCGITQRMLSPAQEWITLPDRFFVDQDGFFFHVGRSDGMFKVQGRLCAPAEVEQVLLGHPAVWECAVVGEEDEDDLTQIKAFVVLNVGQQPSSKLAQELMELVKRQVSPHKALRTIEFVDQLPRAADGRVQRWRLRSRPPSAPKSPPAGLVPIRLK
ncbi:MAG: AMP-binding protein [Myxococcales bacterium]|nr:AMP-binding protein [Myxococcales bacterium]